MADAPRRRLRDRILPPLVSVLGPWIIRAFGVTWKIERHGYDPYRARKTGESDRRTIVTLWHETLFPLAYVHRNEGAKVLVSRHGDGELIVRALLGLGFSVARGSTTRGGAAGLRDLVREAKQGDVDLSLTPDGPKGPRRKAQPGVAYVSAMTRFPIVPLALVADRAWRINSWDRFMIPKPFAKVVVVAGELIEVPRDDLEARLDEHLARFEDEMARARTRAEEILGRESA